MEIHLVKDLAIVMGAAGAMTLLCHRLKQPVVIGYLLAGLLIGPYTPPFTFVTNLNSIHTMAELGLVFLLFSLGLEFNLPKIRRVGASAGLAAVLEVIGMTAIGYGLGRLFGWSAMDSLFLGAILSISSTTIIVKVFMDFKMIHEKFVQVVFGILVLEDIVAVAFLSILSGLGSQGGPDAGTILFSFLCFRN
jgi:CPA2 family monovalent cation:H+ antiporter-2